MRTRLRIGLSLLQGLALAASVLSGLAPAAPALAAPAGLPEGPVTLTADRIEYNAQTNVATADGAVRVSANDAVITADHLEYDANTQDVVATGNVTLARGRNTAAGALLRYNLRTQEGRMEPVVAQYGPMHVSSRALETKAGQVIAYDATATTCDPRHPIYKVTAKRIVIVPGDRLTAYDASLYVANVRMVKLPSYTTTLKPLDKKRHSGPSAGYTYLDGPYVQYNQFFDIGSAENYLRIRYGTMTSFTVEDVVTLREPDHLWTLDLGRLETYSEQNNLENIDQYSLNLLYDNKQLFNWPLTYQLSASVGSYTEVSPPAASSTRAQGLVTFSTDTFQLSPSVFVGVGGQFRYDTYGIGQQRTIVGASVATTALLGGANSLTLSYHFDSITGSTPFQFDFQSPASAVNLTYSYVSAGFLQLFSVGATYDFLLSQTIVGANFTLALTKDVLLSIAPQYNINTQQLTEIDYGVNARCDCVAFNIVYRTFPQNPAGNQLIFLVGLTAYPGGFNF